MSIKTKKAVARAGRRKCKRCKEIFYRERGDSSTNCQACKSRCGRCNIKLTEKNSYVKLTKKIAFYKCKQCIQELNKHYGDPDKKKIYQREYRLINEYGITVIEYDRMLKDQQGVCWICEKEPTGRRLSVDHEHQPGDSKLSGFKKRDKVRGLLCWHCNAAIAKFRDDPKCLRRAADYLEQRPAQNTLGKIKESKNE